MEADSVWMHRKLFRDIGNELPRNCQGFRDFEDAISLKPRDKATNNESAEGLLKTWERRGGISLGVYGQLLRLLRDTQLISVLRIAEPLIEQIMTQLRMEGRPPATVAESTPVSSRDCLVSNDQIQTPGDLGLIQCELQDWYSNTLSRIHPIPWCELELDLSYIFTNLAMVSGIKHPLYERFDYGDSQTLSSIFNGDFSKRSVCLIEGPAGIGKSTLCRHLAYLWSNNNFRIGDVSVELVYLLEAKLLTGNFKKCIYEQLFPTDFNLSEDNIYEHLCSRQKKCLLIIDGLDELTYEGKTSVMELLNGHKLRHVNLLLTSRSEASRAFVRYANSHFKINGFSIENVKQYIRKFFLFKSQSY